MQEIEFNLLTEPWVRVRLPDNTVQEVSLTDALVHAQEYMDLAGEMPTQDGCCWRCCSPCSPGWMQRERPAR